MSGLAAQASAVLPPSTVQPRFWSPKHHPCTGKVAQKLKISLEQKHQDLLSVLRFCHWNLFQAKMHKSDLENCENVLARSGNEAKFHFTGGKSHLV